MFGVARKVAGRMLHRWSEERMRVCLEWMGVTGKTRSRTRDGRIYSGREKEWRDTVDCGGCKLMISLESVCCEGGSMSGTEA